MKKSELQTSVRSYLESKNILCFPTKPLAQSRTDMNKAYSGISTPGMADLLAFYQSQRTGIVPVWLEITSHRGRQTPDQKQFQSLVQSRRHVYLVITSVQAAKEFFE